MALALGKLYSNSLLAILNSRIRIEGVHAGSAVQMSPGSGIVFAGPGATERRLDLPYASHGTGRIVDNTVPHIVDVHRDVCRCKETWSITDDVDMISMSGMVGAPSVLFAVVLINLNISRNPRTWIRSRARLRQCRHTMCLMYRSPFGLEINAT